MSPSIDITALLQHNRWIRDLARSLVAESHSADDLVQDAWVAALGQPPELDRPVRGWLATVLRRRSGELARERARRREREQIAARAEMLPSAHEVVEKAALQRHVVEAVLELDEPYRTTVLLRFFEELPPREIARRMDVPVATVNSRLARALESLRERLSRGGGRESWLSVLVPLLREPALAPVAILGVSAMKLTAAIVLVLAVLAGIVLWRTDLEQHAPETSLVAKADAAATERDAGQRMGDPPLAHEETRASVTERAGVVTASAMPDVGEPLRTLRGRVLDSYGTGLSGVALALAHHDGPRTGSPATLCKSGAGGWFEAELAPSSDLIVSSDPRYTTILAGSARVRGATQPVVVVGVRLDLAGTVVDESGTPLAGASVELRLPDGFGAEWGVVFDYSQPQHWSSRSGEDGGFALDAVPAVQDATLVAALGGYTTRVEPAPGQSNPRIEIVLARPRAEAHLVRGIVLGPQGERVRGARVSAHAEVTLSDASGEFALDLDSLGTQPPLRALKRGYVPAEFEPETDAAGRPAWPEQVVLHLGGPPTAIKGRVVDAEHRPVSGARVWLDDATPFGLVGGNMVAIESQLRGDERFWGYVESGDEGKFEISGVLPRDYRVKAIVPESLVVGELGHVRATDSPVEIVLQTRDVLERVAGHVVTRGGKPLAGASVHLVRITYEVARARGHQNDGIERPAVITGADGAFEMHSVPKTGVHLFVTGDTILFAGADLERESDLENIVITATQRFHLQVELDEPHDRADRFRVLDGDGKPIVLNIMQDVGAFFGPEQALVDGRSAVIALDDSATTLVLLRGGEEVGRVRLSLAAGSPNVVRY